MPNSYYNQTNTFVNFALARGDHVNTEIAAIETGFDAVESAIIAIGGTAAAAAWGNAFDTRWFAGTTTGSSNAYVITLAGPPSASDSLSEGYSFWCKFNATNTASITLNVGTIEGAVTVQKYNSAGTKVNLASGDIVLNRMYLLYYDGSNWVLSYKAMDIDHPAEHVAIKDGDGSELQTITAAMMATCTELHYNYWSSTITDMTLKWERGVVLPAPSDWTNKKIVIYDQGNSSAGYSHTFHPLRALDVATSGTNIVASVDGKFSNTTNGTSRSGITLKLGPSVTTFLSDGTYWKPINSYVRRLQNQQFSGTTDTPEQTTSDNMPIFCVGTVGSGATCEWIYGTAADTIHVDTIMGYLQYIQCVHPTEAGNRFDHDNNMDTLEVRFPSGTYTLAGGNLNLIPQGHRIKFTGRGAVGGTQETAFIMSDSATPIRLYGGRSVYGTESNTTDYQFTNLRFIGSNAGTNEYFFFNEGGGLELNKCVFDRRCTVTGTGGGHFIINYFGYTWLNDIKFLGTHASMGSTGMMGAAVITQWNSTTTICGTTDYLKSAALQANTGAYADFGVFQVEGNSRVWFSDAGPGTSTVNGCHRLFTLNDRSCVKLLNNYKYNVENVTLAKLYAAESSVINANDLMANIIIVGTNVAPSSPLEGTNTIDLSWIRW